MKLLFFFFKEVSCIFKQILRTICQTATKCKCNKENIQISELVQQMVLNINNLNLNKLVKGNAKLKTGKVEYEDNMKLKLFYMSVLIKFWKKKKLYFFMCNRFIIIVIALIFKWKIKMHQSSSWNLNYYISHNFFMDSDAQMELVLICMQVN